ncbi:MAG: helix-turn-helix domain-containing protein [Bradyrhizobium sp.]
MSDFRAALNELPVLHAILYRYVGVVLMQTSQSGACNSAHRLKQRLARWLLLARSGLQRNELPLTHLTLAGLLGVRRASVTECLEILQRERVIETSRNLIVIKHPELLKSLCCDCFRLMEREYERSVGQGL